jgi:predicted flap endonuclease-1-like 5' DNA nuclease
VVAAAPPPDPEPAPFADEPIAAAAPLDASPAALAASDPAPAPSGTDDLTRMKGVGPKLAERLNALGVASFAQIAALSPADAEALDAQLGTFQGRIHRDRWIEQAGFLARGDQAGYEAVFGKL